MNLEWEQIVVDAADPFTLGEWWRQALDWVMVDNGHESGEVEIRPTPDRLPGLLFARVDKPKTVKNRWHPDFRPTDQDAELTRLLGLGARRVDVAQGNTPWVVLADPEGNEFCVHAARRS